MPPSLETSFAAASPRLTPRHVPLVSVLIYAAVLVAWGFLSARALWLDSVWAWSAGIAYILYDTLLTTIVFGMATILPPRRANAGRSESRPTLGIVIAARNEAMRLPLTLQAIREQGLAADQVVVVDDGSTDDTSAIVSARFRIGDDGRSRDWPALRLVLRAHGGKASALNAALVDIGTDIVVTLDADTQLEAGALEAISDAFATDRDLVAIGGVLVPYCDATPAGRVLQFFQTYEYIRNVAARIAWARGNCLLLISGAFAGYRRDALQAIGGFDERSLVEDYEVTHRLQRFSRDHRLNWRLTVLGDAIARTEAPSRAVAFLRQRRRWFAGFLETQYWNRDMTGNARYGAVGLAMLPVKALDTLQPIYGLLAFAVLLALIGSGQGAAAFAVSGLIVTKIAFDFAAFLWIVWRYRRFTHGRCPGGIGGAFVAAVIEPFSFQLLRHAGATWGWLAFLRGRREWGHRSRFRAEPEIVTRPQSVRER